MQLDQALDDREPQADAGMAARQRSSTWPKRETARGISSSDMPIPVSADGNRDAVGEFDRHFDTAAGWCEFDRVAQQVQQHLFEFDPIRKNQRQAGGQGRNHFEFRFDGARPRDTDHVVYGFIKIDIVFV